MIVADAIVKGIMIRPKGDRKWAQRGEDRGRGGGAKNDAAGETQPLE